MQTFADLGVSDPSISLKQGEDVPVARATMPSSP